MLLLDVLLQQLVKNSPIVSVLLQHLGANHHLEYEPRRGICKIKGIGHGVTASIQETSGSGVRYPAPEHDSYRTEPPNVGWITRSA